MEDAVVASCAAGHRNRQRLRAVRDRRYTIAFAGTAHCRREFGGLKSDQVKRLKELEAENTRLRKAAADLTLGKQILAEAARGNF